jgi:enoyl-CoA hydratase
MPIHYEKNPTGTDEHLVLITIDRPEAKNSLDMYHFRDLAGAWKQFRYDDEAWVAIITGVERNFMAGADLKTYIPQITALSKQISTGEVTEVDGCRLSDGTRCVGATQRSSSPSSWRWSVRGGWDGDARRSTSDRHTECQVRRH